MQIRRQTAEIGKSWPILAELLVFESVNSANPGQMTLIVASDMGLHLFHTKIDVGLHLFQMKILCLYGLQGLLNRFSPKLATMISSPVHLPQTKGDFAV